MHYVPAGGPIMMLIQILLWQVNENMFRHFPGIY
jgi:hypothetical protein